jgi:acyl-CoA hydrolase
LTAARLVIVVDPTLPDVDAPKLPAREYELLEERIPLPDAFSPPSNPVDDMIGAAMASLVPPHVTIQYGPGSIGDSAVRNISVPVKVHSGMVTDALAELADKGLLENQATSAYLAGGSRLRRLAEAGFVRVRGIEHTHSAGTLAGLGAFVALNTALQVGLDGSVNVESVGGEQIGGVGGHPDFCAAASASGISIIGLRSVRSGRSTIVPRPDRVTTARTDVDVVVTEHGIADLRGLDDHARARQLIGIASPQFRADLENKVWDS